MLKPKLRSRFILLLVFTLIFSGIYAQNFNRVSNGSPEVKRPDIDSVFYNYVRQSVKNSRKKTSLQRRYLDSASAYLKDVSNPNFIAAYYGQMGRYYLNIGQYDSSLYYYRKNYAISTKYNLGERTGNAISNLGRYYIKVDNYDSALYYFNKCLLFFQNVDTSLLRTSPSRYIAQTYSNIGSIYLNKGEYDSAAVYYYKALNMYKNQESITVSVILNNLGNIYFFHQEYQKALDNYNKALDIINKHPGKFKSRRASLLTNAGGCYKELDQLDTAMLFYQQAMEIRRNIGPLTSVAGLHDNIGHIKKAKGDYAGALKEYKIALKIRQKGGSKRWLASSYGNIGLLYVKMGKNKEALPYLKQAIEIADSNSFVEVSLAAREGLSIAYKNMGNYKKSLEEFVRFSEMNDSIHSVELEEKLNYYKQLFETEKKDHLIQKLEEEQKLADLRNEKQKILVEKQRMVSNSLAVFVVLLLLVLFISIRYFKMKRKADQEMHLRKEQINKQKTLDLMKELEVTTIKSYMEGQEKERARIAGDLHDRLGSLLSTVKLHFNSLEPLFANNPEAAKNYNYAIELLDKSVEEVRSVSRNLTKGVLTQFGLYAAVESMRDAINSSRKIKMTVINSGMESRLKSETEITLFRVIQELVTNVIRHAQTDEIFVQFVGSNDRLNIIVEDHGVGFDKDNIKSEGIGLNNLKERINNIGGEFTIDSIPGEGTTIIIDIPYETRD